ncbi:MAG: hypothetical protein WDW36_009147 [Sanguina aurantia]
MMPIAETDPDNDSPAGVAYRARHQVAWGYQYYGSNRTNNEAEYGGAILGLKMARRLGIQRLVVHGDSKLVIKQMQGAWKVNFPHLRVLWEQATGLLRGFEVTTLAHVYREQNLRADALSNMGAEDLDADEVCTLPGQLISVAFL